MEAGPYWPPVGKNVSLALIFVMEMLVGVAAVCLVYWIWEVDLDPPVALGNNDV